MAKNKPKIRFKGFEDEWDYTTLGCLGDTTSGIGFPIKEQGGKEGIPFFKVSDMNIIGNERILKNSNNYVTKMQIDHNRWNPITNIPAIFFAKIGAALLQNRKRLVNEPFLLDNNTMAFSMNNKNGDFFLSLFETLYLPKYAQTGALPSYGEKDIKKIEVNIPSPSEQQKIGEYFKQLDELIEAREKKLDKLRQFKMAMLDKMFPKEGESVPAVRFRGFTEPWKSIKLQSIFDFNLPHYSHSRDKLNYESGEVQNIHYGDILIKFENIVYVDQNQIPFITDAKADNFTNSKLEDFDIIFADTAEDETCGKCIEIQDIGRRTIVAGLHTIVARPLISFAPCYLGYYFNSFTYHDQLIPLMQGIKVLSINKASLYDTYIYYPDNNDEQQKIGEFFRSQDEEINNLQEQINKLKTFKQACLSQMFV